MLRNLRFGLLALANDLALFLAIAPIEQSTHALKLSLSLALHQAANVQTKHVAYPRSLRLSIQLFFFGAKQCQPYHPHRQTINICVVYANSNNNNSKYLQQPAQLAEVGSLRAANVWLQVTFWAKPHSQLIAKTTAAATTKQLATAAGWCCAKMRFGQ